MTTFILRRQAHILLLPLWQRDSKINPFLHHSSDRDNIEKPIVRKFTERSVSKWVIAIFMKINLDDCLRIVLSQSNIAKRSASKTILMESNHEDHLYIIISQRKFAKGSVS